MAPTLLKGETDLMYVKQQGTRREKLMDLYPLTLVNTRHASIRSFARTRFPLLEWSAYKWEQCD